MRESRDPVTAFRVLSSTSPTVLAPRPVREDGARTSCLSDRMLRWLARNSVRLAFARTDLRTVRLAIAHRRHGSVYG